MSSKLPTPFNGHDHEPWQGESTSWPVGHGYSYIVTEAEDFPEYPQFPLGVVGKAMQFVYDAAPHPMREAAIVGGLGLACGVAGRCYNVNGSGLNEYFALLAPSSSGKEAATSGVEKLIGYVVPKVKEAATFMGPSDVSSKPALHRYLSKSNPPSCVMFINEIGEWLGPIVDQRASEARQSLRKMLLDLSEKSGKGRVVRKSAYADTANNIDDVHSPAVTIVGDSNPTTFYEVVTEKNTANGFFARWIVVQNDGGFSAYNEVHSRVEPSAELIEELSDLCAHSLNLNHANTVIDVEMSEGAKAELTDFRNTCIENRDNAQDDYKRAVWGRGNVHASRIAAVLAVGRSLYKPTIEICDARWAISFVVCSIERLLNKFEDGEVGEVSQSEVARLNETRRAIRRYLTVAWPEIASYVGSDASALHRMRIVPYGYILRSLTKLKPFKDAAFGKSSDAVKHTLRIMVESGELAEMSKAVLSKDFNYAGNAYAIARPASFLE